MRRWGLAIVLAVLGMSPAVAEDPSPLRSLVTAGDSRGWEAVGRLDIGPSGFCTGALIEPDVVLTAAHCLFNPETRARIGETEIEFLAGWRNGRAAAYRSVAKAAIHPDYVYTGPEGTDGVANDVALLRLAAPIRNISVKPFRVDQRPRKGAEVGVVSYALDRAMRPAIQEVCHVLGRPAGSLVMSCDVDFGSSGAPVFVLADGEPRIVSVISAKAEVRGRAVSLGSMLGANLTLLQAMLDAEAEAAAKDGLPRVRRLTTDAPRHGGGAKFLRP